MAVPVVALLDRGTTVLPSGVLHPRLTKREARLHPKDAEKLGVAAKSLIQLDWDGTQASLPVRLDQDVPQGVVLIPRSVGVPLNNPTVVDLKVLE